MALADYFPRDAVAISQVLQGFKTNAFIEELEGVRVAVAFGEEAATTRRRTPTTRSHCKVSGPLVSKPHVRNSSWGR